MLSYCSLWASSLPSPIFISMRIILANIFIFSFFIEAFGVDKGMIGCIILHASWLFHGNVAADRLNSAPQILHVYVNKTFIDSYFAFLKLCFLDTTHITCWWFFVCGKNKKNVKLHCFILCVIMWLRSKRMGFLQWKGKITNKKISAMMEIRNKKH